MLRAAGTALAGLALAACGAGARPPSGPVATSAAEEAVFTPASGPSEAPPLTTGRLPFRMPCAGDDPIGCTNACADGVLDDCVTLGVIYLDGNVMRVDHERAAELFRRTCTEGSARGCLKLGDLYHDGTLKDDPAEEAALYRKACDKGANLGCLAAGKTYLEGRGVGVDPVFAATLFARVCERGNAQACLELGHLYDRGEGVRKDPSRAVTLFTKACQLGLDEGCLIASRSGEVLPPRN
ncbi:tetratricopeptide repeat protein [Polyangium aurulentum]|uniref:tetratricopeptide repeat protein n=1 Tax=Polyangium aurulentum TaxID=2567896 RepID=UPI0010AE4D54|nr:tetratricopeptide repeat protein [Polyangium aurulentum]UQA58205.1 sel1 repeat family protein [Polyangium aurulentum]